jgi:uncharacterized cupin superfamily protein
VLPGKLNNAPHCHFAEEEIFVILDGEGHLLLWETDGVAEYPVRRGTVIARPPGTGVAHAFRAGAEPLFLLMYGTREPQDICFYPRSGRLALSGLGMIARVERSLEAWDDED